MHISDFNFGVLKAAQSEKVGNDVNVGRSRSQFAPTSGRLSLRKEFFVERNMTPKQLMGACITVDGTEFIVSDVTSDGVAAVQFLLIPKLDVSPTGYEDGTA